MEHIKYQDINAETIDRWIEEGWEYGRPITHDIYHKKVRIPLSSKRSVGSGMNHPMSI